MKLKLEENIDYFNCSNYKKLWWQKQIYKIIIQSINQYEHDMGKVLNIKIAYKMSLKYAELEEQFEVAQCIKDSAEYYKININ